MWKRTKKTLKSNNLKSSFFNGRRTPVVQIISLLISVSATIANAETDITAIGQLTLKNPETGLTSSCSATLIAPSRVATVASCLLSEETKRHAQTAQVCFRVNGQRACYTSTTILTHSGYLNSDGVNDANNLAYIDLVKPVKDISPVKELNPRQFERLLKDGLSNMKTIWVGYNRRTVRRNTPIRKSAIELDQLEYDYVNRRITLETAEVVPGRNYEGTAVLTKIDQDYYLLGMLSSSFPDDIVHYYPEVNPCDEDPIIVRYIDNNKDTPPIMRSLTQITAYPVAACGMTGLQSASGYDELKCVRMARRTDIDKAIDAENPIAMRQQAVQYIGADDTTDLVIDIYKLLDQAIKLGDSRAHVEMAKLLLEGEVFPRDSKTAQKLLAEQTGPDASWLQAQELLAAYNEADMRSINSELDKQLANYITSASEAGIPEAQYFLGRLFQFGIGVDENKRTAYRWYAHAAMQGHARAQFQLGTMWVDGRSVRRYPEVGFYWIRQAAANGYIKAQNYLALQQRNIDDALDEYEFEYSESD